MVKIVEKNSESSIYRVCISCFALVESECDAAFMIKQRSVAFSRELSMSTEELFMENHVEVWKIRWHARNRLKFTRGNAGWTALQ